MYSGSAIPFVPLIQGDDEVTKSTVHGKNSTVSASVTKAADEREKIALRAQVRHVLPFLLFSVYD